MILTVTLNAAVDKTYRIDGFALNRVHRPSEWKIVAGGKGINVARVYRTLGGEAIATGFLGGDTGSFIAKALREEGLDGRFVRTHDPSRVCTAVVDPVNGTQTEINEVGPVVRPKELLALRRKIEGLLAEYRFDFLTLSGSAPPGVPDTIYADLIDIAQRKGVRAVLDASGEPLRAGVAARPWMVKPNIHELSMLLGSQPSKDSDIIEAARGLCGTGIEVVCVTRGSDSVLCATADGAWKGIPPAIRFASAVGSGDSFLAAFLRSVETGGKMADALRMGIGAGTANAAEYGAGFCSEAAIREHADRTRLEAV